MATYDKILDNENSRVYFKLEERHIYGSSRVGVRNSRIDLLSLPTQNYGMRSVHYSIGPRTYELSNQLPSVLPSAVGNVLSVISDTAKGSHAVNVIPQFSSSTVISEMRADIRVAQDYSPFGVTLEKRNFVVDEKYRYGFNGKESIDEVSGDKNSYDFGARIYNPRIGKWMSIDPLFSKYPDLSCYIFVGNMPINAIDPDGMKITFANKESKQAFKELQKAYKSDKEKYKTHLDNIVALKKAKDVIFEINVNAKTPNGYNGTTRLESANIETGIVNIAVEVSNSTTIDKRVILADELTTAGQYLQDKIGFRVEDDGKSYPTSYEFKDEVLTQIASLDAANALGVTEKEKLPTITYNLQQLGDKRDNFSTSLFVADFYEALPRTENSGSMGLSDNKLQNLVNNKSKNTTQFVIRDVENNKNKIINRTE